MTSEKRGSPDIADGSIRSPAISVNGNRLLHLLVQMVAIFLAIYDWKCQLFLKVYPFDTSIRTDGK